MIFVCLFFCLDSDNHDNLKIEGRENSGIKIIVFPRQKSSSLSSHRASCYKMKKILLWGVQEQSYLMNQIKGTRCWFVVKHY